MSLTGATGQGPPVLGLVLPENGVGARAGATAVWSMGGRERPFRPGPTFSPPCSVPAPGPCPGQAQPCSKPDAPPEETGVPDPPKASAALTPAPLCVGPTGPTLPDPPASPPREFSW